MARKCIHIIALVIFLTGQGLVLSQSAETKGNAEPQKQTAQTSAAPAGPITTEDLNQFSWRLVGPWAFSGRITNFAVPRGQSQTYYVLAATGGLWKTVDGGIHFETIFDKSGVMSMGYLAIAPSDANILYLGTGESLHARASYHGKGVWKSTDAGKTWNSAGLEKSYFIPKIEVDPKNPDIVYVACEGKLYDNEMDCERGLYKTTDGGKSWARVLDLKDRGVGDFVIDPRNSDIVIASAYRTYRRTWTFIDRQEDNSLYKSTDGGKTWKKLTSGLPQNRKTGRNGLAVYEKNPAIIYARVDDELVIGLSEQEEAALFRAGDVFKDGSYFNKWKASKINPELAKLVKFTPLAADSEKDLAKKLNDLVKDKEFAKKTGVDFAAFNQAALKIYSKDKVKNEKLLEAIGQIDQTLKREAEKKDLYKKVNPLVLFAFFADCEGVQLKDGQLSVLSPEKLRMNFDFVDLVSYDPKKVKDEKDLINRIGELSQDPELTSKLKVEAKKIMTTALKTYKDKKEIADKFKDSEEPAEELDQTKGRYRTINRYILEVLYGDDLAVMEPEKKAGIIYRSEDQGESWKAMTDYRLVGGSDVVNQVEAGYNGRLIVDPNDDKVLYAHETQTVVSKDSGKTFKFTKWEDDGKAHVDSRAVWVDPLNSKHILNANDGGVSESWDGGEHWSQKDTIGAQQFYDISVDNDLPYNIMGGTQDNGCWLGPSQNRNPNGVYPADWSYLPSGDGFYAVRDSWNPEYIYWESQFGYSNRGNFKAGETIPLSRRNTPEENAAGNPPQRYQWNSPIVLSPHNPGIVFVCSQYVHRSLRHGDKDSWVTISPDLTKGDKDRIDLSKKTNLQYATIFTFAESPKKPGIYWAGTDDGNLQLSRDGGVTWTNMTANFYDKNGKQKAGTKGALIPYDRWVKRVLPSQHDENTCYVTYSGYRTHNEDKTYVYVTRDLGKSWEDLSQKMMNPVNDIEEDPDNPDVLYLATDYGLFVTIDRGANWLNISSSAPNVIIKDLAVQKRDRDLAIATYGRGIFIADIGPFKEFKPEIFAKNAHLFNIESAVQWKRIDYRGQTLGEFAKAENPPPGSTIYYYLKQPASSVSVTVRDLQGNLVQELRGKTGKGIQKVFWGLKKKVDEEKLENLDREEREKLLKLEPGTFKIVLTVDGKDLETKDLVVLPDPKYQ